jgi:phosphoribosylanthranilate isomerase
MEIKICGITALEDAVCACTAGADAIGFIFYRKSPRYVTPETVRDIIKRLPQNICKVGVFVNHDPLEVREIFTFCRLSMIQLHGDESPEYCFQFPAPILIKAISPQAESNLARFQNYPVKAILIDAHVPECYGGTGKKSNWDLAAKVKKKHPVILAGGLNTTNIWEAIKTASPHAVDVNSGVERSPGKKDLEKVKEIIEMVHNIRRKVPVTIFNNQRKSRHFREGGNPGFKGPGSRLQENDNRESGNDI